MVRYTQQDIESRKMRGAKLLQQSVPTKILSGNPEIWTFPSGTNPSENYSVTYQDNEYACSCKDYKFNVGLDCKHIHAVRMHKQQSGASQDITINMPRGSAVEISIGGDRYMRIRSH